MDEYRPEEFEAKWGKVWEEKGLNRAVEGKGSKNYVLIEFPYPSGNRLHVGHARSYCCLDAVVRKRRMQGSNVMYPMGWDAFGLPAENYAIKTGIHPSITTAENIANSKKQAMSWGLSFDWEREINTTDPEYYKWTQWIFVQLFKKGLAYKAKIAVNWCPSCKINLANEEVLDGKCERCGSDTERRMQSQWLLAITRYADRLLDDLKTVDFREDIALQQINWIGRKEGAKVSFESKGDISIRLDAFTTRIDTIFGATFVVAAPEVVQAWIDKVPGERRGAVEEYVKAALNKGDRERKQGGLKTGVDTGIQVLNPATGELIPVWVADYVLTDVGTGVVMGVPGHDVRDAEFALKYDLGTVKVVEGGRDGEVYEGEGKLMNSGKYEGMESSAARKEMLADKLGEESKIYHLRDWVFSRQHYWGEPIPMVECELCGWEPVPESELPVKLPEVEKYQPSETGESPLAQMEEWVATKCPKCEGKARRETDTMPNWAGSSWYYLRYCDPNNDERLADMEKLKYWLPVDWYNGGMEHTTLHLLYSRFWHKFLYDLGVVPTAEPYARRTSHGVILGPDGRKMSKSKGNVINPDEVVEKFGADTLRVYEMFIGPFEQMIAWSWEGVEGVHRFIKRVWVLINEVILNNREETSEEAKRRMGGVLAKVERDLEAMKFNTAIACMMEFVNWWGTHREEVGREGARMWVLLMAPVAPFVAEELFHRLTEGAEGSVHEQKWPQLDEEIGEGVEVTIVVQVDGKVRGKITVERGIEEVEVVKLAKGLENVRKYVGRGEIKTVFVPEKIVNFITK